MSSIKGKDIEGLVSGKQIKELNPELTVNSKIKDDEDYVPWFDSEDGRMTLITVKQYLNRIKKISKDFWNQGSKTKH